MVANDHGGTGLNNDSHAVRPVKMVDFTLVIAAFLNLAPRREASVLKRLVAGRSLSELPDGQAFEKLVDFRQVLENHRVDFLKVPHERGGGHHVWDHCLAPFVHQGVVVFAGSETLLEGLQVSRDLLG